MRRDASYLKFPIEKNVGMLKQCREGWTDSEYYRAVVASKKQSLCWVKREREGKKVTKTNLSVWPPRNELPLPARLASSEG